MSGEPQGSDANFLKMLHSTADVLLKPGLETALRVWVALARRADFDTGGGVFVSYGRLKADHGISRDAIAKGLRELEKLGLIERQRRFNKSTVFTVKGLHLRSASPTATHVYQSAPPTTPVGVAVIAGPLGRPQRSVSTDTNERPVPRDLRTIGGPPAPDARVAGRPGCTRCGGTGRRENPSGGTFRCSACNNERAVRA